MPLKNNKSLGQHWLKDRAVLLEIASLGTFKGSSLAVEVGPGLGTLTSALLRYFDKVVAIELDSRLAANLPNSFPGKNLTVVNQDVLSLDLATLPLEKPYSVVGNIPYYITSPIIQKFLLAPEEFRPKRIVLLVQKEVAERLAATSGNYSILGLSAQIYAQVSLGPVVGRDLFTPPPKVDSQVVILEPYDVPLATETTIALIKHGFSAPRKKLISNLSANLHLSRASLIESLKALNISPDLRPADLSISDWLALEKQLSLR